MKIRKAKTRKGFAAGVSLLMVTLSVAVPLLERADLTPRTAVESEHAPGECPTGHDHTVCTQVGANLSIAAERHAEPSAGPVAELRAAWAGPKHAGSALDEGHPSRAPPLA